MRHFLKRSLQLFACMLVALFVWGLFNGFSIYHGWVQAGLESGLWYLVFGALPALILAPVVIGVIAYAKGGQDDGG